MFSHNLGISYINCIEQRYKHKSENIEPTFRKIPSPQLHNNIVSLVKGPGCPNSTINRERVDLLAMMSQYHNAVA